MTKIDRKMNNQAVGLLPLLLFMFLDNFFSYMFSYLIAFAFSILSLVVYRLLSKDKMYQFMLLPAAATLSLYSIFILLKLETVLFDFSPLITEILLVVVLAIFGFTRRIVLRNIRNSNNPAYKRTLLRTTLNEFYFVVQVVQGFYTFLLFAVLLYTTLPESLQNLRFERFLYREMGIVLGLLIIGYEQIRISLMRGSLKKEMWLPVLDEGGKVIGCIARSVSRAVPKKYYHPIVRVAVIYDGMLFLTKRGKAEYIAPDMPDYPFHKYVLFKQTIDNAAKEAIGHFAQEKELESRFLVRYTFENEKVKHLVSLYVLCLRTPEQMNQLKRLHGKLWTSKQIDENLGKGLFSEYFEKEYSYLKNTVLLAEKINRDYHSNRENSARRPADRTKTGT